MCEDEYGGSKIECKYEFIKDIDAENLLRNSPLPCKEGFIKYVDHFGLSEDYNWSKVKEDWIIKNISGGIDFLVENGFIKEVEKFSYSEDKIYVYVDGSSFLRKLCKISGDSFGWTYLIGVTTNNWNPYPFKTLRDAIDNSDNKNSIIELSTPIEFIDWIKQNIKSDNK